MGNEGVGGDGQLLCHGIGQAAGCPEGLLALLLGLQQFLSVLLLTDGGEDDGTFGGLAVGHDHGGRTAGAGLALDRAAVLGVLGIIQSLPICRDGPDLGVGEDVDGVLAVGDLAIDIGDVLALLQGLLLGGKLHEGHSLQLHFLAGEIFHGVEDGGGIFPISAGDPAGDPDAPDFIGPGGGIMICKGSQVAVAILGVVGVSKFLGGEPVTLVTDGDGLSHPVDHGNADIGSLHSRHQQALVTAGNAVTGADGHIAAQAVGEHEQVFTGSFDGAQILLAKNKSHRTLRFLCL